MFGWTISTGDAAPGADHAVRPQVQPRALWLAPRGRRQRFLRSRNVSELLDRRCLRAQAEARMDVLQFIEGFSILAPTAAQGCLSPIASAVKAFQTYHVNAHIKA